MFYDIPCVCNMIIAQQLNLFGKIVHRPHDHPAQQMLAACCKNVCWIGPPSSSTRITSSKTSAFSLPMYLKLQSTTTTPTKIGSAKSQTNNTWINSLHTYLTNKPPSPHATTSGHDQKEAQGTMMLLPYISNPFPFPPPHTPSPTHKKTQSPHHTRPKRTSRPISTQSLQTWPLLPGWQQPAPPSPPGGWST